MKPVDVCIGCGARKLVNPLRLCKRCNKEAYKYLSQADLDAAKAEKQAVAAAAAEAAAEEGAASEAKAEKAKSEEPKEGEEKEEKAEDAGGED